MLSKDLNRYHRLGSKIANKTRPILIQFSKINDKIQFTKAFLTYNKNSISGFTFREHLTNTRLELFKVALKLKHDKKIATVYSKDGVIILKKDNSYHRIITSKDMNNFIHDKIGTDSM